MKTPIPTFVQHSRIGQAIFQIRGEYIEISLRRLGRKIEARVPLRRVSSEYQCLSQRIYLLFVIPLVASLVCAAAIRGILHQGDIPHVLVIWPGLIFCTALWAAIQGTPPVVFYQFRNHWGNPIFNIVRERKQAGECDAFVAQLVQCIELLANEVPPAPEARADGGSALSTTVGQDRWKVSIILGAFAAALPLWQGALHYLGDMAFPFVFLVCVVGVAMGVLSFLAKETWRWLALVGMALSLVPPFFY